MIYGSLKRNGGALILSGASQVISSLTNFGIVLYLVRVLEKNEFGFYSAGFAVYLIIAAILAAAFTVQYVVNNPDRAKHEQRSYAMHHVVAVILVGTVIVMLMGLLETVLLVKPNIIHGVLDLPLVIALAALCFATRDIVVRIAFVERREWLVLGSVLTVAIVVAAAFLIVTGLSVTLSATLALCIVALSQLAGAVLTLVWLDLPWHQLSLDGIRQAFLESWNGGRWHAMTSVVYSMRTQVHNFVILPILGAAALAEVNAARILLTPAVMIIPPLYQVVMPRLAEMRDRNPDLLRRYSWTITAVMIGFALIYSVMLLWVLDIVLPLTLGPSYTHLQPLVLPWCAVTVFMAARNGLTMELEIHKKFRDLLVANSIVALAAIMLVTCLSIYSGEASAVWALVITEIILCLMLYRALICKNVRD